MLRMLVMLTVLALFQLPVAALELEVTVQVTSLNRSGFVEFKAESDDQGEKATGHLTKVGEERHFKWNMGGPHQNIWFWWDTLDGEADLKVEMKLSGQQIVFFEGHCKHAGKGEQQVIKTLDGRLGEGKNKHYRLNPGMGPHLSPNSRGAITHIKDCDKPPHKAPEKGGREWDEIWE